MVRSLLVLVCLITANHAASAARTNFTCKTRVVGSYYVMPEMKVSLEANEQELSVQPLLVKKTETKGSTGTKTKVDADTGYASFKGFDSDAMFGELGQYAADQGIYVYVSPEMLKGLSGRLSLYARGAELGFEAATYSCTKLP